MRPSSHCAPSPPATAPQHPNFEAQQGKDNRLSHGARRPESPVKPSPVPVSSLSLSAVPGQIDDCKFKPWDPKSLH
ncbi:hypothetical protein J3E69DRAFT_338798 [Trichoderma sp. SZMC 28015]